MCGIAGLYLKNPELRVQLGHLFSPMLEEMTDRGPDSAGFAVYTDEQWDGIKLTVRDAGDPSPAVQAAAERALRGLADQLDGPVSVERRATHLIVRTTDDVASVRAAIARLLPAARVTSAGRSLEIYKEIGRPGDVLQRFGVAQMTGSHMIGHTRMATESAVTTEGAHPFNTGNDLCLVHNGSLSNHHTLKRWLTHDKGIEFQTENDSEVAAGYLTWRLAEGATLAEALEAALVDLDGFYTFTVGTRDGFAVLRDPVACKPAVMAETDDWVAMASEFRALARLPGVEAATVWEPKPATVYTWGRA